MVKEKKYYFAANDSYDLIYAGFGTLENVPCGFVFDHNKLT